MNITCPGCGISFPFVAGTNDADARKFARLMGELPPEVARPLTDYLQLFKPPKSGLTWKKILKVSQDIAPEIIAGEIRRDGRQLTASAEHWANAMQQMTEKRDKLTLPLKSNGYLREIVFGLADKAAAEAEAQREKDRQSGRRPAANEQHQGRTLADINADIRHFEKMLSMADDKAKDGYQATLDKLKAERDGHQS